MATIVPLVYGSCLNCGDRGLCRDGLCLHCEERRTWSRVNREFCALIHRPFVPKASQRDPWSALGTQVIPVSREESAG
jgi:hypothetical protein